MRSVILSASASCFVACPGCYNHFSGPLAQTNDIVRFVAGLVNNFNLRKITVGGGDPLARPDIIALLRELRRMGLYISLDTVGTPLLREAAIVFMGSGVTERIDAKEVADQVDKIGIPVDGSSNETIQYFRRGASLEDQKQILELLSQAGAKICVNSVIHQQNVDDIEGILDVIRTYSGVVEWQMFQFMPIGPLGYRNRARYEISDDRFQASLKAARQLANEFCPDIEVKGKSKSSRKNSYLLIDGVGTVWIPKQTENAMWSASDSNQERALLGNITSEDIFNVLETTFAGSGVGN